MNLAEELNESQRRAVEYCDGPSLVIAGAGAGKTRVLTYKIAYLIEQGMSPYNILALTFTNKAASEMRQRIASLVGDDMAQMLWMGTFHSVFARILRMEYVHTGYERNFTIYDETDSKTLMKRIIKEMGLDEKVYKPQTVLARIEEAKNRLVSAEDYGMSQGFVVRDREQGIPEVEMLYQTYSNRCRQANAMDFDDLLLNTWLLFERHEEVRRKWAERFHFVLVDEYQDTNYAQHQIVLQLTRERKRVCVVGDDAQSIYSFRGANIDNILSFTKSFQGAQLFKLERNYRSTKLIVAAANSLIKHNEKQIHKEVYSENAEGERLIRKDAYSDKEEALIVCRQIRTIMNAEGARYSDFAILYRTNSQSRQFEEALRHDGIPYRIYGGLSFYARKEVKDAIAYFRMVVNPHDEEAFKRIINYPARGIGDTTVSKLLHCASISGVSAWAVVCQPERYRLEVSKSVLTKLTDFKELISSFISLLPSMDASELGSLIIHKSGIASEIYSSMDIEDVQRQENLEALVNALADFVATARDNNDEAHVFLPDYLQEVALVTDLDRGNDESSPKVSLMTVHAAKGLEFPTVFVVGLEENIFPSPMCTGSLRALEEERRLLYVAITRAAKHCYLTSAQNRWRYGKMETNTPSRFLRDIDSQYIAGSGSTKQSHSPFKSVTSIRSVQPAMRMRHMYAHSDEEHGVSYASRPKPTMVPIRSSSVSGASQGASLFSVGDKIEHERFGVGEVVFVDGESENTKVCVDFRSCGRKLLLLKFAKIRKL